VKATIRASRWRHIAISIDGYMRGRVHVELCHDGVERMDIAYTPAQARRLAAALIRAADEVEKGKVRK
jgi:hypothetical protein